jgi:hypothetical protein
MDFYAGKMSLLNDIAQIENDAGRSGSEAAPAAARPEGYAPLDAHADGAVRSDHRLVRGVQSGHRPGQSEHVYQQAFSEIISGGAKPDQPVDKAFKADRGDLRQIPDRERLTLRRFAACQPV